MCLERDAVRRASIRLKKGYGPGKRAGTKNECTSVSGVRGSRGSPYGRRRGIIA